MAGDRFAPERNRSGFPACATGSLTIRAKQPHAAESNLKQIPYSRINEAEAENSSGPLPGVCAFVPWLPLKVSAPKRLSPPWLALWWPGAGIGAARHNGDTRRSRADEYAPPDADTMEAVHPSIAIPGGLFVGNSAYQSLAANGRFTFPVALLIVFSPDFKPMRLETAPQAHARPMQHYPNIVRCNA